MVSKGQDALFVGASLELPGGEASDDNPGLDKYHVHTRCFAAWELERVANGP